MHSVYPEIGSLFQDAMALDLWLEPSAIALAEEPSNNLSRPDLWLLSSEIQESS